MTKHRIKKKHQARVQQANAALQKAINHHGIDSHGNTVNVGRLYKVPAVKRAAKKLIDATIVQQHGHLGRLALKVKRHLP